MDLNKVMLIGRLTRDPEVRNTPQGVTVANFGLATGRVWKDAQGNQQENTEFHNVVAWRRLGEICGQYLSKGRQVYIEGHLQTRNWQDQNGAKHYRTEVIADNMIMLGSRSDNPAQNQYGGQNSAYQNSQPQQQPSQSQAPQRPAQEPAAPPMEEAPAGPVNEEEIRIEDIPF